MLIQIFNTSYALLIRVPEALKLVRTQSHLWLWVLPRPLYVCVASMLISERISEEAAHSLIKNLLAVVIQVLSSPFLAVLGEDQLAEGEVGVGG